MCVQFKKYLVMPESNSWFTVTASSPEMAYRQESHWFAPGRLIAVLDPDTMKVEFFSRVDVDGKPAIIIRRDISDIMTEKAN